MNIKILTLKIIHKITVKIKVVLNKRKFKEEVFTKLPSNYIDLVCFSYDRKLSKTDTKLGQKIESFRTAVADQYKDKSVSTFASPRSGAELFDSKGKVIPGNFVESKKGSFARTGTGIATGIQLKKITEAISARTVLELGTNTGLSGCYFISSLQQPHLCTIEGSGDLCKIAEENLGQLNKNFEVINGMFDDVIENLIQNGKKFDLAFVDGQHEEQATLHYAEKLKSLVNPGGGILFDDIYWSEGMQSAWLKVSKDQAFSTSLDLGSRGLCILATEDNRTEKLHFELTKFTGKPLLNRAGW